MAATFDAGPPEGGLAYVSCLSTTDLVNAFGPRSAVSAAGYDAAEEFFADGGGQMFVTRVTDTTATKASLVLNDASSHPTIQVTAKTAGADGNQTSVQVSVANSQFTIAVYFEGNEEETWGPYSTTSALYAGAESDFVDFAQASGTGNTTAQPASGVLTALTGGADANDLTDSSHVGALANFPKALGPGTVILPGKTSQTAAQGLAAHAAANNRWAVIDLPDGAVASSVASAAASLGIPSSQASYCLFVQGSPILPPLVPGANRVGCGSSVVAALRAQAAATGADNAVPAGRQFPVNHPLGFTTFYGALPSVVAGVTHQWSDADVATLEAGGVNVFANLPGALCLYGFVSPLSPSADSIYWQASAATERMALTAEFNAIEQDFLFEPLNSATISAFHTALVGVLTDHFNAGALWSSDGTAQTAFSVDTGPSVNNAQTAQAGQLLANVTVHFTPYADNIVVSTNVLPLATNVPASA